MKRQDFEFFQAYCSPHNAKIETFRLAFLHDRKVDLMAFADAIQSLADAFVGQPQLDSDPK